MVQINNRRTPSPSNVASSISFLCFDHSVSDKKNDNFVEMGKKTCFSWLDYTFLFSLKQLFFTKSYPGDSVVILKFVSKTCFPSFHLNFLWFLNDVKGKTFFV